MTMLIIATTTSTTADSTPRVRALLTGWRSDAEAAFMLRLLSASQAPLSSPVAYDSVMVEFTGFAMEGA
jgi:hypothetical protein